MAELRKIGVLSVVKITFVLNVVIGLVIAVLMFVMSQLFTALAGAGGGASSMLMGPLAIIVLPLVYGIIGSAVSAIGALIYNLIAARVGGVQVTILFPVQK